METIIEHLKGVRAKSEIFVYRSSDGTYSIRGAGFGSYGIQSEEAARQRLYTEVSMDTHVYRIMIGNLAAPLRVPERPPRMKEATVTAYRGRPYRPTPTKVFLLPDEERAAIYYDSEYKVWVLLHVPSGQSFASLRSCSKARAWAALDLIVGTAMRDSTVAWNPDQRGCADGWDFWKIKEITSRAYLRTGKVVQQ